MYTGPFGSSWFLMSTKYGPDDVQPITKRSKAEKIQDEITDLQQDIAELKADLTKERREAFVLLFLCIVYVASANVLGSMEGRGERPARPTGAAS